MKITHIGYLALGVMMMDLEFPTEGEPVRHKAAARRLVSRVTLQVPPPTSALK